MNNLYKKLKKFELALRCHAVSLEAETHNTATLITASSLCPIETCFPVYAFYCW